MTRKLNMLIFTIAICFSANSAERNLNRLCKTAQSFLRRNVMQAYVAGQKFPGTGYYSINKRNIYNNPINNFYVNNGLRKFSTTATNSTRIDVVSNATNLTILTDEEIIHNFFELYYAIRFLFLEDRNVYEISIYHLKGQRDFRFNNTNPLYNMDIFLNENFGIRNSCVCMAISRDGMNLNGCCNREYNDICSEIIRKAEKHKLLFEEFADYLEEIRIGRKLVESELFQNELKKSGNVFPNYFWLHDKVFDSYKSLMKKYNKKNEYKNARCQLHLEEIEKDSVYRILPCPGCDKCNKK